MYWALYKTKISATFIAMFAMIYSLAQPMDTVASKEKIWKKAIVPVSLITIGLIAIDEDNFISRFHVLEERQEHFSAFSSHLDDYLQYAPIAVGYGLEIAGVKGKNSAIEKSILLLKSELLMCTIVTILKNTTNVQRPDSSSYNSFPSGHTAQAFVAATFLHKEYGSKSIWYSIGGYTIATAIGTFRVLNNRHWISDVLVGAGVGILSTELVYATHQYKWTKRKMKLAVVPTAGKKSYGLYACLKF